MQRTSMRGISLAGRFWQTNKILTKHFNRWVSAKTTFYDLQKWMAAADKSLRLSDFADEECWLGIDLASKVDLNAVIPVFRRDIGGITHFYCVIQNVVGRYLPGSDDIVRPVKEVKQNKIDGAVGLMMGIGRAMLNSAVIKSVYDEEDIAC